MGKNRHNLGHNTFAFGLIFFGVIILLDRAGIIESFSFMDLWPIILVIIGINTFSKVRNGASHYFIGLAFVLSGGVLLLRNFELIPYFRISWQIIWPVWLIFIGLKIFINNRDNSNSDNENDGNGENINRSKGDDEDYIDQTAFLSGTDFRYSSKTLKGGNLSAVMGGCKVILTDADMANDKLTLNVFAFWGGIEIYIPKNWKLNVKGIPIMGAIEHKIISEENGVRKNKTLIIKGTVIMAGVEIKS